MNEEWDGRFEHWLVKGTGFGAGLALLFIFFNKHVEVSAFYWTIIDYGLSLSSLFFCMSIIFILFEGFKKLSLGERASGTVARFDQLFGLLLSFLFVLLGAAFIWVVPIYFGTTATAIVAGVLLFSSGLFLLIMGLNKMCRGMK